ncbi:MAG TPA: MlaD family protein [Thermoleophilaceae bacterium]|jgi:ABC-type transporter Mla subunit MlaD|nr:MlaD family protein [Thermoleophilaceae bacterium]
MRRALVVLSVLGVCAGAFVLAGASDRQADGTTYKIQFDNAFGLTKGGDFRVGGVNAGQTTGFEVTKKPGETPKAVVTAEVSKPGFDGFREDASCDIRPQSLIGEYYVDCQPGTSDKPLPNNTVTVEHNTSTIPTDIVNDIMRRPYRERFRLLITELGTGLAGRPDDLSEVLRRAHPGLRETSRVLRILGDQNEVIKNFITDSDTVVNELEKNKRDVVRWVREAGDAAEISATRRTELRAQFQRFPEFLDELRPTMARLGELADEQTPLLADLQRAAPDLDTFFTRIGPFSEASRPAVRSLGKMGKVGTSAFTAGKQEVAELRRLAVNAPPFAKPLRQFLQTIDDRKRAIEVDPRAKAAAPPAPDPTAIKDSGGFTGMEAIWNYFFWQTLSINMLDDDAHMLRASLSAQPDCMEWRNEPPKNAADMETFKKCNSYLGPNQPGIFSPDPIAGPNAANLRAQSGKPASRVGERRAEGQPEAGPLPGQVDLSKPQIVLPPDLQRLLDSLTRRQLRELNTKDLRANPEQLRDELRSIGAPAPDQQTTGQLLDYLLAP